MQKIHITLTDDLDGTDGAQTVRFSLDGDTYEIDLSEANHAKLKQIASLYIGHARKAARARPRRQASVYERFGTKAGVSDEASPPPFNWSQRRRATTAKPAARGNCRRLKPAGPQPMAVNGDGPIC